jgi:hypothetical protein
MTAGGIALCAPLVADQAHAVLRGHLLVRPTGCAPRGRPRAG